MSYDQDKERADMFKMAEALVKLKANSDKLGKAIIAYMDACKASKASKREGFNSMAIQRQMNACDDCRAAFEDVLASSAVLAQLSVEGTDESTG